jgi:hypothetical protein
MNTTTQLNHLAEVQDEILDILNTPALTAREIRDRINGIYPNLAAVVDHLVAEESNTIANCEIEVA